ncbi:MAG: redoxin domain-containing protein [Candidatus Bipolaricaulis sp.]|nr:redoxin domain-containing protein [Candidatus Bipolaricaulis sp.]MDD5219605.1 redoxin domain-containing protein [Candidatus Bipolaricaulis sp.]MDD5647114.1 redoxin domain-containing protein [Candidatus Bipolaricaulis sp.]
MEIVRVGTAAPPMALKDQDGDLVNLTALQGKRVLLSFHPLAWTEVCRLQMQALEARATDFTRLGTVPLGISVDPVPCKKAWAEAIGIERTRLLSDFWPHGRAAAALGIFREKQGFSERAAVILDEKGIVRFAKVYPLKELPDLEEQMKTLREL